MRGVLDVAHRQSVLTAHPVLPLVQVVGGVRPVRQKHIQRPLAVIHQHLIRVPHAVHPAPPSPILVVGHAKPYQVSR